MEQAIALLGPPGSGKGALSDDVVVERISAGHQGRDDDRPETVQARLRVYHRETEPLVA